MEITINAVTANRRFLKAKYRNPTLSICLSASTRDIDSSSQAFDVLQVLFVDKPASHLKSNPPRRRDRIHQVEVGIPEDLTFTPDFDDIFIRQLVVQVQRAIGSTSLAPSLKASATALLRECETRAISALQDRNVKRPP